MSYSIWRDQLTNVSMSDCSGNQSPASLNCRQQISAFWVVQKYFNSCITFPICFQGELKIPSPDFPSHCESDNLSAKFQPWSGHA